MKVLFVCLGNICRSPTAEAIMRHLCIQQDLDWEIDSAGTAAYHIGKTPDERSQMAAAKRGISMKGQRARQVTEDDFYRFDYIFAMDRQNFENLKQIQPDDGQAKLVLFLTEYGSFDDSEVPDPYYGGEQGFEYVLDLLQNACEDLIAKVNER